MRDARPGKALTDVAPPATTNPSAPSPTVSTRSADAPPARFRLGNRPPLTGIRAFGIWAVLIYHANFHTFPGAWQVLGMFFTLSGFLITAMLMGERQRTGRISLKHFYARRALRLLPPLGLSVALLSAYGLIHRVGNESARLWGDMLSTVFYVQDYRSALGHEPFWGFFAQAWSLSVEEQFYLVWSLLLVFALATRRRRASYAVVLTGIAASFADRTWISLAADPFTHATFARVYYAFDTRADALFLGCLMGLVATDGFLEGWSTRARRSLSVAALASTAVLVWVGLQVPLGSFSMTVWWLTATELLWAVVLLYFVVNPDGIGSRFVGLGVFVWMGDLSYTLYLVHWPIYVAMFPAPHAFALTEVERLALTLGIAIASWYLMEKKLRNLRRGALA